MLPCEQVVTRIIPAAAEEGRALPPRIGLVISVMCTLNHKYVAVSSKYYLQHVCLKRVKLLSVSSQITVF